MHSNRQMHIEFNIRRKNDPVLSRIHFSLVTGPLSISVSTTGIDAIERVVNQAKELGQDSFHVMEYEIMSTSTIDGTYDLAMCNFSLLGK